jgi:hypothetical protein
VRGRKVFFCTSLQLYANTCGEDPRQRAHHRRRKADVDGPLVSKHGKLDTGRVLIDFGMACDTIKHGDNDSEKYTIKIVLNSLCWTRVSILLIYFSFIEHYLSLFYILTSHDHSGGSVNYKIEIRIDVLLIFL